MLEAVIRSSSAFVSISVVGLSRSSTIIKYRLQTVSCNFRQYNNITAYLAVLSCSVGITMNVRVLPDCGLAGSYTDTSLIGGTIEQWWSVTGGFVAVVHLFQTPSTWTRTWMIDSLGARVKLYNSRQSRVIHSCFGQSSACGVCSPLFTIPPPSLSLGSERAYNYN